ncbi:hypothetical protein MHUMG1_07938 [Metarhizium humberi]|uniref:Hydrophobin n=1 Tax=Metarhizium humberi TaxID=2596975 RepID=A0A9P8M790_9HYPO|nr:hypothetical protein MHUMG1_07938 [Metarhizium humberi]
MLPRLFSISAIAWGILGCAAAVLPIDEVGHSSHIWWREHFADLESGAQVAKCSPVCCDHIGNVPFKSLNPVCFNPNNWDGLACGFGQTRACCMKVGSPSYLALVTCHITDDKKNGSPKPSVIAC